MAFLHRAVGALDRFQQSHVWFAFPVAVLRKFSNDQGGGLCALIAYYGFLAVFLLFLCSSLQPARVRPRRRPQPAVRGFAHG